MRRRSFIKKGALFVPTLLLARKSLGQANTFRDLAWLGYVNRSTGLSALNSDWLARILAAGGARPSDNTFAANDVWYASVLAAGLVTSIAGGKIKVVNTYAPDNLIACITPLIKGTGFDSWTNSGSGQFQTSDLNVNGLKGNGLDRYLNSNSGGVVEGMGASSNHGCIYVSEDDRTSPQTEYGQGIDPTSNWRQYYHYSDNHTIFSNVGNSMDAGTILGTSNKGGYLCQSRTSTTQFDAYFANSTTPHAVIYSNVSNVAANLFGSGGIYVHATNEIGSATNISKKRISFVSWGLSITSAESLANYNAAQALRISYGGGFV